MPSITTNFEEKEEASDNLLKLWISGIINIECDNEELLNESKFDTILGSPSSSSFKLEPNTSISMNTFKVSLKIDEQIYVDSIDVYQFVCDEILIKIEAKYEDDDAWMCVWQSSDQPSHIKQEVSSFISQPVITPTPFRCNIFRFSIKNNIGYINAIKITGMKDKTWRKQCAILNNEDDYSSFSKGLYTLIDNDLFADVYFEVEGKRIAAHRNILSSRSEYFNKILSENRDRQCPIYIPNITYDAFFAIIAFMYTGHFLNRSNCTISCCLDLMQIIELFGLKQLEELVFDHFTDITDLKNVVWIYAKTIMKSSTSTQIVDFCLQFIINHFSEVVASNEFRELDEDLMKKLLKSVVPKLPNLITNHVENDDEDDDEDDNEEEDDDDD